VRAENLVEVYTFKIPERSGVAHYSDLRSKLAKN
jgi:hypothetical protein